MNDLFFASEGLSQVKMFLGAWSFYAMTASSSKRDSELPSEHPGSSNGNCPCSASSNPGIETGNSWRISSSLSGSFSLSVRKICDSLLFLLGLRESFCLNDSKRVVPDGQESRIPSYALPRAASKYAPEASVSSSSRLRFYGQGVTRHATGETTHYASYLILH